MLHGLSSRRNWNTIDILYNKEYNYGLIAVDDCTTTTVTYTVKEN